jgi:hypothetical protein
MDSIHMSSGTFRMTCNAIRSKKMHPHYFKEKCRIFFNENKEFILVYIDDMLIFLKTYKEHIAHLDMFFRKVE